jgi:hypothetical protein
MSADRADQPRPRRQLLHGYTNASWRQGHHVFKRYSGPDALSRLRVEVAAIQTVGSTVRAVEVADPRRPELCSPTGRGVGVGQVTGLRPPWSEGPCGHGGGPRAVGSEKALEVKASVGEGAA